MDVDLQASSVVLVAMTCVVYKQKAWRPLGSWRVWARFDEVVEGDSVDGPPADEIQGAARERIRDRLKGVLGGPREKGRRRVEFLLLPGPYFTFWYRDVQSRSCSLDS